MSNNQKKIFLICSISAPVLHYAALGSWIGLLLITGICFLLSMKECVGNDFSAIQFFLIIILLGEYAQEASRAWDRSPKMISIILILLAVLSTENVEKIVCAVSIPFLILIAGVLGTGLGDIELERINESIGDPILPLVPVLLLPMRFKLKKRENANLFLWIAIASATLIVWIQANLTVLSGENIFVGAAQSVSGIGSITRLDGVVSVILTIGWYSLLSALLKNVSFPKEGKMKWIAAIFASLYVLVGFHIAWEIIVLLTIFAWIILPEFKGLLKRILDTKRGDVIT